VRRVIQCAAAIVLAAACALGANAPGVWLDVPFVAQPKDGCGAASIAMVMQYWERNGHAATARGDDVNEIQRKLYSPKAKGIFASDMEKYFQKRGYQTFAIRGEWQDLQENLVKGRPLIAALRPATASDTLHYVVVAGMDWRNGYVFVNDPARRKLFRMTKAEFEKEWDSAGNWTLLPVPR